MKGIKSGAKPARMERIAETVGAEVQQVANFVAEFATADSNATHERGKFWRPGFDPVTLQAAENAFSVAMVIVRALAEGAEPPY